MDNEKILKDRERSNPTGRRGDDPPSRKTDAGFSGHIVVTGAGADKGNLRSATTPEKAQKPKFRASRRTENTSDPNTPPSSSFNKRINRLFAVIGSSGFAGVALFIVVISGPLIAWLSGLAGMASLLVSLTSVCLALLGGMALTMLANRRREEAEGMRSRFEQLEDMAWELSESEERYRALAETFGDILVLRDGQGEIRFANQAFNDLTDGQNQQVVLDTILDAGDADPNEQGKTAINEREICIGDGDAARWFEWVDLPVRDRHHGDTGILSVARDITAFKQVARDQERAREKAEQTSRAKSRFLAMVSHEMRTPLNGILGMSRLLSETRQTAEQANYTNALSRSADGLLALINGMLDMTMIEAGRFTLTRSTFDIANLIVETGEVMAQKAHEKDLQFAIRTAPDVPQVIHSDPDRIRQIAINLIGNAIKFTRTGGVSVVLERMERENDQPCLRLSVSDTGPGIGEKDAERIFAEFERLESGEQASVGGAGLGLSIARALAGQLGGGLQLASTGANGSCFTCTLPLEAAQSREIDGEEDQPEEQMPATKRNRAILISKNTIEADAIRQMLADKGIEVEVADDTGEVENFAARQGSRKPLHVFLDGEHLGKPHGEKSSADIYAEVMNALGPEDKCTILLKPNDRQQLDQLRKDEDTSWLMRPVRARTLYAIMNDAYQPAHISVPVETSAPEAIHIEAGGAAPTDAAILLAEDNDINALLVKATLKQAGMVVDRVENGEQAVAAFTDRLSKGNPYQLVLMDRQMPVMDGLRAIAEIRAMESADSRAVIEMLTADEQSTTRDLAMEAGADSVLVKPIEPSRLLAICKNATGGDTQPLASTAHSRDI